MGLIQCPECDKEVSDKSEKCIHCGYPLTDFLEKRAKKVTEKWEARISEIQQEKNYEIAKVKLDFLASEGCSAAYNSLGFRNMKMGNYKQALKYFKKGLELDPKDTVINQNMGYLLGTYDEVYDPESAIKYLKISSELDNHQAQRQLGVFFDKAMEPQFKDYKNDDLAIKYYSMAALAGDYISCNNLGVLYGRNQDYVKAIMFCKLSLLYNENNDMAKKNLNTYMALVSDKIQSKVNAIRSINEWNIIKRQLEEKKTIKSTSSNKVLGQKNKNGIEANKKKKNTSIGLLVAFMFLSFVVFKGCASGINSSDGSYKCSNCSKTYTNSIDRDSILKHGMCRKCYSNYKATQDLKDAADYIKEHNR